MHNFDGIRLRRRTSSARRHAGTGHTFFVGVRRSLSRKGKGTEAGKQRSFVGKTERHRQDASLRRHKMQRFAGETRSIAGKMQTTSLARRARTQFHRQDAELLRHETKQDAKFRLQDAEPLLKPSFYLHPINLAPQGVKGRSLHQSWTVTKMPVLGPDPQGIGRCRFYTWPSFCFCSAGKGWQRHSCCLLVR